MPVSNIDNYMSGFPPEIQKILQEIRSLIKKIVPQATETISYGIPTFDLDGEHLVHFAAFKKHIGFFPTPSPIPHFQKELTKYKTSKGTIQFSLSEEIPYDLIERIVKFRLSELKIKN